MPIALVVLGFSLVAVGVFFAVGGLGGADASGSAMKGISVSGPSWLILVALGVGTIVFGAWQFEERATTTEGPPKDEDAVVTVAENAPPIDTYGDDPVLDELWDYCSIGDWEACDALYLESPIGSEYEYHGATCGGIVPEPDDEYCAVENRPLED